MRSSQLLFLNDCFQRSQNDDEKLLDGSQYRQMIQHLIEFILGPETYLQWLSQEILPSQMENYTIIETCQTFPPLIVDPFGQTGRWFDKNKVNQTIYFDQKSVVHRFDR